jgi:hypothetical protein
MATTFPRYTIRLRRDTYKVWTYINPIIEDGELILVTNIPGWWRWRKTRLKVGDGKTPFNKLRYL